MRVADGVLEVHDEEPSALMVPPGQGVQLDAPPVAYALAGHWVGLGAGASVALTAMAPPVQALPGGQATHAERLK